MLLHFSTCLSSWFNNDSPNTFNPSIVVKNCLSISGFRDVSKLGSILGETLSMADLSALLIRNESLKSRISSGYFKMRGVIIRLLPSWLLFSFSKGLNGPSRRRAVNILVRVLLCCSYSGIDGSPPKSATLFIARSFSNSANVSAFFPDSIWRRFAKLRVALPATMSIDENSPMKSASESLLI